MVDANNSFMGLNRIPELDAYLRNLNDFRIAAELSFLPVIQYFTHLSESTSAKIKLPTRIFEDQKEYLEQLGIKYFHRPFDFIANPENSLKVFDLMSKIIGRTRKTLDYCLLDSLDFLIEYPDVEINIHPNLLGELLSTGKKYHHDISRLKCSVETNLNDISTFKKKSLDHINKYVNPFQLYTSVLSDVKRAIDFEVLKLYDYLLDHDPDILRSNKLMEVEPVLQSVGNAEYGKVLYNTKIKPWIETELLTEKEIVVDQWASNLRRLHDLKELLSVEFILYINKNAKEEEKDFFMKGAYPELTALFYQFYSEEWIRKDFWKK